MNVKEEISKRNTVYTIQGKDNCRYTWHGSSRSKNIFSDCSDIYRKLSLLDEVGLGYLKLGQNTLGLSGGESQRIKLAKN